MRITGAALAAWLLVAVYYFYQYALRSAPSFMMPQLTEAFRVNALGVSAIVGMFYYGYSPFSLVAGTAIDRFGARRVIPIGAALVGVEAMLFGTGNLAEVDRIAAFAAGLGNVERVDVLPFHQMGRFKWEKLKMDYQLNDAKPPSQETTQKAIERFPTAGLKAV